MELSGNVMLAMALCVVSAGGYAVGALVQQRLAVRPMRVLVCTPHWWFAIACNGLGALLHVVALRYGSLMLVQALGVLTLVLAVPLAAIVERRRISPTEAGATVLAAAGLCGLMTVIGATPAAALTGQQLANLLLFTAAATAFVAVRSRQPGAGGLWSAAAGGMAFGVASAAAQTIAVHNSIDGFSALIRPAGILAVLAVAGLSVTGLWFTQQSYRHSLAAPLAVSTLANPLAAAAIGVVLLGQHVRVDGSGITLFVLCAAAVAAGIWLLASAYRPLPARPVAVTRA